MKILKTTTLPRVLSNIVVLRQKQLLQNETEDMSVEFIKYRDAYHKNDNVYAHTYSISELNAVGITNNDDIIRINNDSSVLRDLLSEAQLDMLLQSKRDYIINNYKERNRYVKMLMGEPYDDTEKVYLPDPVEGLDSSKSIDEFSPSEIKLIMVKGILDKLIKDNTSLGYLKYVYRKIPFMTTRTADIYGLLYVDTSTNDGYRFLERYEMTRLTFKRTMFNQMYYDLYPMYEDMMISFISASTLFDMMATEPYSIADFDFSSEDTLTSIYKTFSIPYLEKLPKQIKIALGERINRIILNKGSKSSLMDIIKAFGIDDIYQYVLHKEYKDTFDPSLTPEENYKLSFVKVRIDSNDIVRDVINSSDDDRIDYDKFVENDKRWGVEGDNLRSYILSKDFSYLRTKYIGVNETVDLMKDLTSSSQFMSYIFYNKDKMSNFKVKLERSLITVNIWELFVYAIVLIMNKNGYEDIILRDIEGVAYVHGLNTEYIITEGTLELFRKHLPDKYHRYIDGWVKLNEGLPMSEFMKTINDNTNLMKELKHIILNFDGPYSVYKYLCKIETLMNSMKRNDALGTLANYTKYSDFIKDSNHELFTYLELLRHSENASTNMSDELISIISDLNTVLELSNLSDDSLDNFAFVDKMKADEMYIIKISLFQIMAFLKTYTVDLKENDKVNQLYYTVKSIDNMFMTVYGNMYERSKTIDDITTITTYSKLISNVYISDHISDASTNLQVMSDKYVGHHNNYLLDIVTVNDSAVRTNIEKIFDDKEYGDNTDSIVLRTDTYFVNSTMSDASDSIECTYSKWNIYDDANNTEDNYVKESYELSMDNVIRYLDYRNFLDTSDKWIDSKSSDRYFDKSNFTSSLFNAYERYIQFDGYTSTIEHHGPLYPTNNFTMTLEFKVIENRNSTILFAIGNKFLVVIKENILSVQDGDNTYDVTLPFQINTDVIMTLVSHDNNTFDIYCNKIKVMTHTTTFDFVGSDTFALQNLAHGTLYKKNIWYRRLLIHSVAMTLTEVLNLQDVLIAFRNK